MLLFLINIQYCRNTVQMNGSSTLLLIFYTIVQLYKLGVIFVRTDLFYVMFLRIKTAREREMAIFYFTFKRLNQKLKRMKHKSL